MFIEPFSVIIIPRGTMIKGIIFDLDGTLIDTLKTIAKAANFALWKNKLPLYQNEQFLDMIGKGKNVLVQKMLEPYNPDENLIKQVTKDFDTFFLAHPIEASELYPGIYVTIEALRDQGIKTAVLSNKDDNITQLVVKHFFADHFQYIKGRLDKVAAKPDRMMMINAMAAMKLLPMETLMVGDMAVDIEFARNSNVSSCAVTWGFGRRKDLTKAKPDFIIDKPVSLLGLLLEQNHAR